jgi:hypothetical protein
VGVVFGILWVRVGLGYSGCGEKPWEKR